MQLALIVAHAANRVIGREGRLPWRLPEDLAHFKRTTMGRPVIMGRKTWDSIGRPLPGRRNVVVSRDASWHAAGAEHAGSLDRALAACQDAPEVFVIGGAQLYALALPRADRIVATEIAADYDGDARFPPLDDGVWRVATREAHPASGPAPAFTIVEYLRRDR